MDITFANVPELLMQTDRWPHVSAKDYVVVGNEFLRGVIIDLRTCKRASVVFAGRHDSRVAWASRNASFSLRCPLETCHG